MYQIFSRARARRAQVEDAEASFPRRNTNSLIGAIAAELASEGIDLIDSTYFLQDYLPAGNPKPSPTLMRPSVPTLNMDWRLRVKPARLDLGQTIVIAAVKPA